MQTSPDLDTSPDVLWIFSSGRSGTTWLMRLLAASLDVRLWNEPRLGIMLNLFIKREGWRTKGDHLLSEHNHPAFFAGIRGFVEYAVREKCGADKLVVIKDPNGSIGAPLISRAMPESRVILMMRDPRDIAASSVDGKLPGGWQNPDGKRFTVDDPLEFTKTVTANAVNRLEASVEAYDAHEGPRSAVRYEDLVADTAGTMIRMLTELKLPVDEVKVTKAVAKLAFDNVPEERRGPGKRFRKAEPGSWSEDLTPEQIAAVEEIGKPILSRFY